MTKDDRLEGAEVAMRRDAALRRALSTPPQPNPISKKKKGRSAPASGDKPEPTGEAS